MGNVNAAGIWTPDADDNLDPEVWSAAMGGSIMNGLGDRMNKQEAKVSLRAWTPVPFDVISTGLGDAYKTVPLDVSGYNGVRSPDPDFNTGNHAEGITIAGNVATVVTSGLYSITGQISIINGPGYANHSWDFYGTINGAIFGLPAYGATNGLSYTGGTVADTRYLIAGDTVGLTVGVGTDHIGGLQIRDAILAMSMAYAT